MHEPMDHKKLVLFRNILYTVFGTGRSTDHMVSYRMTTDRVIFQHDVSKKRKFLNLLDSVSFTWEDCLWQSGVFRHSPKCGTCIA